MDRRSGDASPGVKPSGRPDGTRVLPTAHPLRHLRGVIATTRTAAMTGSLFLFRTIPRRAIDCLKCVKHGFCIADQLLSLLVKLTVGTECLKPRCPRFGVCDPLKALVDGIKPCIQTCFGLGVDSGHCVSPERCPPQIGRAYLFMLQRQRVARSRILRIVFGETRCLRVNSLVGVPATIAARSPSRPRPKGCAGDQEVDLPSRGSRDGKAAMH